MKNALIYVTIIIVLGLFAGCNLLGSKQSNLSPTIPLTPGSTWAYAVYDSTSPPKLDTLRVSILQTDTTSGQIRSLWKFKFTNHTDTITVVSSGSTLNFAFPQGFASPQGFAVTKIVFPLEVGKKWSDDTSSYSVVSKDTVSWSGGTFNENYQMVQKINTLWDKGTITYWSDKGTITYWIEPNIGLVKAHYHEGFGTTPTGPFSYFHATWTLLSYKID